MDSKPAYTSGLTPCLCKPLPLVGGSLRIQNGNFGLVLYAGYLAICREATHEVVDAVRSQPPASGVVRGRTGDAGYGGLEILE